MPSHTSSAFPREVDRRADNALRSTPASAESQHRGTREPFQFGTGTTPDERSGHGRLAEARRPLAREADRRAAARGRALTRTGCSPQTYETRVVSHAGTETHTPNHLFSGTGLAAFLSSSPDPKSRKTIIASPARLADRLTRQRQRLLTRGWIQAPAPFTPPRTAGSARATPTARAGGPRGVVDSNGCAAARPPARLG